MKHLAAIFSLLIASCAHNPVVPPSFGFSGRQCEKTRIVICVPDADMPEAWCAQRVQAAIKEINEAVGLPLLAYGGSLPASEPELLAAVKRGVVPVWTGDLSKGAEAGHSVLGLTSYQVDNATHCIGPTAIQLSPRLQADLSRYSYHVITHELIHALAGDHTGQSSYGSIMAPSVNAPWTSLHISESDKASLRAAYPR